MRVVKRGIPEIEIGCPGCASTLAYTEDDIMQDIVPRNGEWYIKKYIVCPVCGAEKTVSYVNEYEVMLRSH